MLYVLGLSCTLIVLYLLVALHRIKTTESRLRSDLQAASREEAELREKISIETKQFALAMSTLKRAVGGRLIADKYCLEEELGRGGYGVVYKATHLFTGETFAVKIFHPRPGNDGPDTLVRFRLEISYGRKIKHDSVVAVYDGGTTEDGTSYMVMELLKGTTLRKVLAAERKLDPLRAVSIVAKVYRALAVAHTHDIVHRDVKPDNIHVYRDENGDETVKVLDFGVAKVVQTAGDESSQMLTRTGQVVGTLGYTSPERLELDPYDGRSDVYAGAIMLFEMLTGRIPFSPGGADELSLVVAQMSSSPIALCELEPGLPQELEGFILRCLARSPDNRPTADEAAAELERIIVMLR